MDDLDTTSPIFLNKDANNPTNQVAVAVIFSVLIVSFLLFFFYQFIINPWRMGRERWQKAQLESDESVRNLRNNFWLILSQLVTFQVDKREIMISRGQALLPYLLLAVVFISFVLIQDAINSKKTTPAYWGDSARPIIKTSQAQSGFILFFIGCNGYLVLRIIEYYRVKTELRKKIAAYSYGAPQVAVTSHSMGSAGESRALPPKVRLNRDSQLPPTEPISSEGSSLRTSTPPPWMRTATPSPESALDTIVADGNVSTTGVDEISEKDESEPTMKDRSVSLDSNGADEKFNDDDNFDNEFQYIRRMKHILPQYNKVLLTPMNFVQILIMLAEFFQLASFPYRDLLRNEDFQKSLYKPFNGKIDSVGSSIISSVQSFFNTVSSGIPNSSLSTKILGAFVDPLGCISSSYTPLWPPKPASTEDQAAVNQQMAIQDRENRCRAVLRYPESNIWLPIVGYILCYYVFTIFKTSEDPRPQEGVISFTTRSEGWQFKNESCLENHQFHFRYVDEYVNLYDERSYRPWVRISLTILLGWVVIFILYTILYFLVILKLEKQSTVPREGIKYSAGQVDDEVTWANRISTKPLTQVIQKVQGIAISTNIKESVSTVGRKINTRLSKNMEGVAPTMTRQSSETFPRVGPSALVDYSQAQEEVIANQRSLSNSRPLGPREPMKPAEPPIGSVASPAELVPQDTCSAQERPEVTVPEKAEKKKRPMGPRTALPRPGGELLSPPPQSTFSTIKTVTSINSLDSPSTNSTSGTLRSSILGGASDTLKSSMTSETSSSATSRRGHLMGPRPLGASSGLGSRPDVGMTDEGDTAGASSQDSAGVPPTPPNRTSFLGPRVFGSPNRAKDEIAHDKAPGTSGDDASSTTQDLPTINQ
ncbi:hypothetical protein HDU67_007710 [Dinochytrium kinnereticum]|nr:hypothetical protein HDU67_007710 [Dinochytrium kinnereticum]